MKNTTGADSASMPGRRTGVFVCHCGNNIAGVIDVKSVARYAANLPHVVHATTILYACSEDGIATIKQAIVEKRLDRVVIAACTPRTHEYLFKDACKQAGINKHLLEFVNIREQCSWIHAEEQEQARVKAEELVKMGVARVMYLTPEADIETPVHPSVLVIGGGLSGMSAALSAANQGIEVHLVEKEKRLGGLLNSVETISPSDEKSSDVVKRLERRVRKNPMVFLHLGKVVSSVDGSIGDFKIVIQPADRSNGTEELRAGTIIVATGAEEAKPDGSYGYGRLRNVITQLELEEMLKADSKDFSKLDRFDNFVLINCVGARTSEREYCSRFCCLTSIKNAVRLRSLKKNGTVTVLERDVMTCGVAAEEYYRRAKQAGVRFLRYSLEAPPRVVGERKPGSVRVRTPLGKKSVEIPADMVVLTTPLVPREETPALSSMLKIPVGSEGFFLEAHVKLRPVEFANDGIYVCGSARFPVGTRDAISQAYAAAAKAAVPIKAQRVAVEPITAYVIQDECTACGACRQVCPYDAIEIVPDSSGRLAARVTQVKCKGCGCCIASCPSAAIQQKNWGDIQLYPPINAVREETSPEEPKIVIFACNWCSYAGADLAGVSRHQIPSNVRVMRVMCSSRIKSEFITRALGNGIDGVMVLGCHPGECHYIDSNLHTRRRMTVLKQLLYMAGIESERFRLDWISASEGKRFAEVVREFTDDLRRLKTRTALRTSHNRE